MAGFVSMLGANYAVYGIPVNGISVAVAAAFPNMPLLLTGTLTNDAATAVDYTIDGSTWLAVSNFISSGSTWTGYGPSFGSTTSGTIQVRDHNQPLIQSGPAAYNVVSVPFAANALAYFYTNSGLLVPGSASLLVDMSPNNKLGTLTGAPTLTNGFMTTGAPSLLQQLISQVNDPGTDMTLVFVGLSPDSFASTTNSPKFISDQGTNTQSGISGQKSLSLGFSSATNVLGVDTEQNPAGSANQFNINLSTETSGFATSWGMYAIGVSTVSGVTTRTVMDVTRNLSNQNSTHGARVPNSVSVFKMGGTYSTTLGGLASSAFYGIYSGDLTLSSGGIVGLATLRTRLQADLNPRGVAGF